MLVFEEQWQEIMEDSQFSEKAEVKTSEGASLVISGLFYSGTYAQETNAKYAPKKAVWREFFQLSEHSLPKDLKEPSRALQNASVTRQMNGVAYRVLDVNGGDDSGMLTLYIQRVTR